MASDTHSMGRRPQNLAEGYGRLSKDDALLLQENAQAVFENNEVLPQAPVRPVFQWGRWK